MRGAKVQQEAHHSSFIDPLPRPRSMREKRVRFEACLPLSSLRA
jgi:hypothetical protein